MRRGAALEGCQARFRGAVMTTDVSDVSDVVKEALRDGAPVCSSVKLQTCPPLLLRSSAPSWFCASKFFVFIGALASRSRSAIPGSVRLFSSTSSTSVASRRLFLVVDIMIFYLYTLEIKWGAQP